MSCLEYQELMSGYLDDELSKEEVKSLLVHLESCSRCKKDLTTFILQKENLIGLKSLHAASFSPVPDRDFSQKVIEKIILSDPPTTVKKLFFDLSHFINWLVFPIKKPFYAGVYSFLILIGILTGVFLESHFTQHSQKQLLSVYELQGKKNSQEKARVASLPDEERATVFHHVASSSAETLATEPYLLKYTIYTSSSER